MEYIRVWNQHNFIEGLPTKPFLPKVAYWDIGAFFNLVVASAKAKIRWRPVQRNMIEQLILVLEWKNHGVGWVCWVQCANMWQHCSLSVVQWKTKPLPDSILVFDQADIFRFACTGRWICIYQCFFLWLSKQRPCTATLKRTWTIFTMNEKEKAEYAEFNMWQHCRLWAMQRKTKPFPDCILFSTKVILQVCQLKLSQGNKQRQTSVLFSGCVSKNQDSPKASPKAIFQRKNMTEQLILVLTAEKAEYAEYAEFSVPKCQHVATLQFVSCAKRDQAFAEQHPFFHEDNLDKFAYQTFPRKQTQVNISIFL